MLIYTGPGGWNDADFIYTGGEGCADNKPFEHCPGQTDTEYRTEFSMWCIMGSSLLVATDVRNMTDIMNEVGQYYYITTIRIAALGGTVNLFIGFIE